MLEGDMSRLGRAVWVLKGPRSHASSRIHGYLVHEYFKKQGIQSEILVGPRKNIQDTPLVVSDVREYDCIGSRDVVFFVKVAGRDSVFLAHELRKRGAKTIYVNSDMPLNLDMATAVDLVVCPSVPLLRAYRESGVVNVTHIDDAVEVFKAPKSNREDSELTLVWYGRMTEGRYRALSRIRDLLDRSDDLRWKLLIVSNEPYADVSWSLDTIWDELHAADACLVSGEDSDGSQYKSPNRVTQAMALGLPVVATRLESYERVVEPGATGYLFESDQEFLECIKALSNKVTRSRMARNAYQFASENFSIEALGVRWNTLLLKSPENNEDFPAGGSRVDGLTGRALSRLALHGARNLTISDRIRYMFGAIIRNPADPVAWTAMRTLSRLALKKCLGATSF